MQEIQVKDQRDIFIPHGKKTHCQASLIHSISQIYDLYTEVKWLNI